MRMGATTKIKMNTENAEIKTPQGVACTGLVRQTRPKTIKYEMYANVRHQYDLRLVELEQAKADRNKAAMLERRKYLPKLAELKREFAGAHQRVSELENAIAWALGENGDFPPRPEGAGAYWWRTELRTRCAAQPNDKLSHRRPYQAARSRDADFPERRSQARR